MYKTRRVAYWLVLLGVGLMGALAIAQDKSSPQSEKGRSYVCPPCGCSQDGEVFAAPGVCSDCDMALEPLFQFRERVAVGQTQPSTSPKVAILVFDGVQIIDYTGPYEVFGQGNYTVSLVSKTKGHLVTNMGMKIESDYGFNDCPDVDVLVIPGGGVRTTQNDDEAIAWIKQKAEATPHVLSVCNGAFLLAKTGLLNGKSATTFYGLIPSLQTAAPEVKVIRDQRFVENGKFITTAGLSSGIDGSLHLISKMHGLAAAQGVALNMEYNWIPGDDYARANFADRVLIPNIIGRDYYPRMDAPETAWTVKDVHGNDREWHLRWQVTGKTQPKALLASFAKKLEADGLWTKQPGKTKTNQSQWTFTDETNSTWQGKVTIQPSDKEGLDVRLDIARAE